MLCVDDLCIYPHQAVCASERATITFIITIIIICNNIFFFLCWKQRLSAIYFGIDSVEMAHTYNLHPYDTYNIEICYYSLLIFVIVVVVEKSNDFPFSIEQIAQQCLYCYDYELEKIMP